MTTEQVRTAAILETWAKYVKARRVLWDEMDRASAEGVALVRLGRALSEKPPDFSILNNLYLPTVQTIDQIQMRLAPMLARELELRTSLSMVDPDQLKAALPDDAQRLFTLIRFDGGFI